MLSRVSLDGSVEDDSISLVTIVVVCRKVFVSMCEVSGSGLVEQYICMRPA